MVLLGILACGDSSTSVTAPEMPVSVITLRGSFHAVVHPGAGIAEIVEAPDGSRTLQLRSFQTDPGPGLEVYLVAAADPSDSQSVIDAGYVTLGALQGVTGDQMYSVPANVDFSVYRSVTIWCVPFGVNFTTAPLTPVAGT